MNLNSELEESKDVEEYKKEILIEAHEEIKQYTEQEFSSSIQTAIKIKVPH
jgi:hypothetical protein